jgi:hypothetical protein
MKTSTSFHVLFAGLAVLLTIHSAHAGAVIGIAPRKDLPGHAMSPAEFRKDFLRKPAKVPQQAAPRHLGIIQVGGQVRLPGDIAVVEGMTLEDVLKVAGGATEFGTVNRATLHRHGERITVDLSTEKGKAMEVRPYDVLEIPQKMWLGQ